MAEWWAVQMAGMSAAMLVATRDALMVVRMAAQMAENLGQQTVAS
jgi:hypothetical protein